MSDALTTARLRLRDFTDNDLADFAALHADPAAMADLGGPISRADARDKLSRYLDGRTRDGIGRLHVSDAAGFIGYVGICCHPPEHPIGAHAEIGWRLLPRAWGKGYATEAARAALPHAFAATALTEILAYTAADNTRSQAVMARLGLTRQPDRDFAEPDPVLGTWHGLVWVARARDWPPSAR
ncbi:N-acetyltransferase [Roseovarius faecimaris]|uniref:N-acetyltransferase n=1 Tax=Roseovarius faecimaris TaxID=2494550 RepID=A0A6I6IM64_9RHOB|nr:GNAT family N-acetyltransferase [Roseovarius faecimaris]QGX98180.1 N-acetyltransferase [Roseovarius faecimaris]